MPDAPEAPTPPALPASPAASTQSTPEAPRSFSQDEVNALLAKQKRESFGDYGDLKAKASEYDKQIEAQKSEQQRAADALAKAQRDAESARAEALRFRAAATHGVSADYFDMLGTGTEEEVVARAERVGTLIRSADRIAQLEADLAALRAGKPAPATGRPTAALKPGATPENAQTEDDALYESLYGTQAR